MFGLRNIADETEGERRAYPQLNAEFIVSNDPDLIFLADTECCGETPQTVAARAGMGRRDRGDATASCSRWTTTSRRVGGRASSTTSAGGEPSPSSAAVQPAG